MKNNNDHNEEIETYSYVDFIHNDKSKELIACDVGKKMLNANIKFIKCRTNCSGPKEQEAIDYFSNGVVDFGRMWSPAYLKAKEFLIPLVAPVVSWASGAQSKGTTYTSDLIVKNDSKYSKWEDLKGSVFAYNDDVSLSGYVCLKIWMHEYKRKDAMKPYFSNAYATGSHSKSIQAVIDGKAACAVIDRITREAIEKENPTIRSKYRILKDVIIGEMPAQPICIRKNIDIKSRDKILNAFLKINNSNSIEMKKLNFVKYEKVNSKFYEGLETKINNSKYIEFSPSSSTTKISSCNKRKRKCMNNNNVKKTCISTESNDDN